MDPVPRGKRDSPVRARGWDDAATGGSHVPHLQKRRGTFHLRVRVPDDLRSRVGMLEVVRSLKTGSLLKAHHLVIAYRARLMESFELLRAENYTKERAKAVIQACFADLSSRADLGYLPKSNDPEMELREQRAMSEDGAASLYAQLSARQFSPGFLARMRVILGEYGLDAHGMGDGALQDLAEGYARALLEEQRLFRFRLDDRLSPYVAEDPLFRLGEGQNDVGVAGGAVATEGYSLGYVTERYLSDKADHWTPKTAATNRSKIRLLVGYFGNDHRLAAIRPCDIRQYRDDLRRLVRSYREMRNASFPEKLTEKAGDRISPKTARLIFETSKAFFRWATSEAYIQSNPAANIRVDWAAAKTQTKPRRPFTADELRVLFEGPVFTGCASASKRFEPGRKSIKDAQYWLPILGYYTGARLGELVQLGVDDVRSEGGISYLDINDVGGTANEPKHLKSAAAARKIPLHSDLLALGFLDFVRRRKERKSHVRLFPEVRYGADGQASTVFSKRFARLLGSRGLSDPGLVFHSFRHGAQDAFKNGLNPQYVTDAVIGHADGKVSSGYGNGPSLEVLQGAVAKMELPVRLPHLLSPATHQKNTPLALLTL